MSDLISRADAIEAVRKCVIQDVGDWAMLVDKAEAILALNALPSAEAVHKPDYSYEADMVRRLKEALLAEADDRLYIKIYADDEPSVKAEKLYQICSETQKREVTEWLKEYFPYRANEAEAKVKELETKVCELYKKLADAEPQESEVEE